MAKVVSSEGWSVESMTRQMQEAENDELDLFIITDHPDKIDDRFTIKEIPGIGSGYPWAIKDTQRPYWIGRAPTKEGALRAIKKIAEGGLPL